VLSLALTLSPQPCPIAEAHRQALQAEDANPLFLVTLSDCLQADEPDQARALLERALVAPGLAVQDRAAVQARIEQLR
jgi:hypothetical protein